MKNRKFKAALFVLSLGMMMGVVFPSGAKTSVGTNAAVVAHAETAYAETAAYTMSFTSNSSNTSYAAMYDVTINSVAWSVPGNQSNGLKIGGKLSSATDRYMYSKAPITGKIGEIIITHGTKDSQITVNSITVKAYTTAADAAADTNAVITASGTYSASANTVITFDPVETTNLYYRINYNLSSSASSKNYGILLTKVEFYALDETTGEKYKVTYGNTVNGYTYVEKGEQLNEPTAPVKDGYKFDGWYTDEALTTAATFPMDISGETTIYAKWTDLDLTSIGSIASGNIYRVRGKVMAKTNASTCFIQNGLYGVSVYVSAGLPAAFEVGNVVEFTSTCSTNSGALQLGGTIYGDVVASTEENPLTVDDVVVLTSLSDLTSENSGRYVELKNVKLSTAYSTKANLNMNAEGTSAIIYQKDASFVTGNDGTYAVGDYVDVTGCITIYNSKVELCLSSIALSTTYTVNYVSNGGTEIASETVANGNKVTEPEAPTKEATATDIYTFDGWYTTLDFSGDAYDFDTPVTSDVTLYAKWNDEKVSISTSFVNAKTYGGMDFDYDVRTHYTNDYNYVSYDVANTESISAVESTGTLNSSSYKLNASNQYYRYILPENAEGPIAIKVKANVTASGTDYSGFYFTSFDEEGNELTKGDEVTFTSTEANETVYVFEHLGSAKYLGIVMEKATGSNLYIQEFSVGTNEKVTYENFRNVDLAFGYSFDVSAATDCEEVGILYTTESVSFTNGTETLPEGVTKVVNETKATDFETLITIADPVADYETTYDVICYVKTTDGKYYFGEEKLYSIEDMISDYKNLETISDEDVEVLDAFETSLYTMEDK